MLSWMNNNLSPIGLDIGAGSIKMLQLRRVASGLSVIASGQFAPADDLPVDGPERQAAIVQGIGKLLEAGSFRGRRVVANLPSGTISYKNIRLPRMPDVELAQAVQWEAADRLSLGTEPAKVEYLSAGEVRHGEEIRDELIIMAVTENRLRQQIETLVEAGLEPIALEPAPVALARCLSRTSRRAADMKDVRVFTEVGRSVSSVLILRGNQVAFFKTIDIGGVSLNRAVTERLDLSPADACELRRKLSRADGTEGESDEPLFGSTRRENVRRAVFEATRPILNDLAKEIGLCLRYFSVTFRGARPATMELIGGEAYDAQIAEIFSDQLQMEVAVAQPLFGVDLSGEQLAIERRGTACEWGQALGLALRQPASAAQRMRGAA